MKALCSERFTDWSTKFGQFGLRCKEVTGDSELDDLYELQSVHVIMTTPVSPTINRTTRYISCIDVGRLTSRLTSHLFSQKVSR